MDIALVALFMILGIVFFILEIFFLPGVSVGGIAGALFVVAGVWYAFVHIGATAGWLTCIIGVLMFGIAVWIFIKSKTLERLSLTTELETDKSIRRADNLAVGDCGTTLSRLAPMGRVMINGVDYEAKTHDALIDPNVPVVVTYIEDNIPVVKPLKKEETDTITQ